MFNFFLNCLTTYKTILIRVLGYSPILLAKSDPRKDYDNVSEADVFFTQAIFAWLPGMSGEVPGTQNAILPQTSVALGVLAALVKDHKTIKQ